MHSSHQPLEISPKDADDNESVVRLRTGLHGQLAAGAVKGQFELPWSLRLRPMKVSPGRAR
jgi:hypothetical protein